jgi:Domain of unknown function (DUF3854)
VKAAPVGTEAASIGVRNTVSADLGNAAGGSKAPLSEAHRRMLEEESSISPAVVEGRGYWTATRRAQLEGHVKPYQRRVPALVLPTHSPDGESTSLQVRPDRPRVRGGKTIRYETPADSLCILDVHPSMHERARDASVDLWVTEGVKKGDSLTSRGECTVALTGVWNWQRAGELLPCWQHIALEGRTVRIVFDSDVMAKPEVQLALERLVDALEGKGAKVPVVYLPDGEDGEKVGVDDFLAGGGTVAELRLMARPYKRADVATVRLTRDERLQAAAADLWTTWRGMRVVKQPECTDMRTAHELIVRAERGGKLHAEGLRVVVSVRTLALALGISTQGALNSLRRLESAGFLRPDNEGRARDKAGAYVLFTGRAQRRQDGRKTGLEGGQGKDREREKSFSDAPYDRGVYVARAEARPVKSAVPELRWSRAVVSWEYDKRGRRRRVVEPLARLGKKRQLILEHLEERGGVCTVTELMARFAGNRTRPRDFKRRTLAMLTETPAVIVVEGDVVSLGGRWRESLEHAREIAGEQEAARLQAQKYDRQREAFRRRDEVEADPVPEMRPIDDMRSPWPTHPEGCACRECVKRFGKPEGQHHPDCNCAPCFTARKEEALEGGHRRGVVPLAPRRRARKDAPPPSKPHRRSAEVYFHPGDCACEWCAEDANLSPSYATPRSVS